LFVSTQLYQFHLYERCGRPGRSRFADSYR